MENYKIVPLEEKFVEDVFLIEKTFFDLKNSSVIRDSLSSETLDYFVLLDGENVIGFYECSVVLDEAELFDIAIDERYQGKALSKMLMEDLLNRCKEKQVRTIFLEVNTNNIKAINLYTKFGFKEYSRRKIYYGDNDAILMKLELV
jgi:ribosomal-protein-alanine N-acetyltransferase